MNRILQKNMSQTHQKNYFNRHRLSIQIFLKEKRRLEFRFLMIE